MGYYPVWVRIPPWLPFIFDKKGVFMPKNVLVTGGCGFIGSHLVDKLIELGYNVSVIDNFITGKMERLNPYCSLVPHDISENDLKFLRNSEIDTVFHLAALPSVQRSLKNPLLTNKNNVNGLVNLLEKCNLYGVRRVVFSSSSSIYGRADSKDNIALTEDLEPNPLSPYALQKLIGEQYCHLFSNNSNFNLETVCLRYFNVYGEGQNNTGAYVSVTQTFLRQYRNNEPLTIVPDGNQRRDFTYVGDVVNANIQAMLSDKVGKGEILNVGSGENHTINEIASWFNTDIEYIEPRIEPRFSLANIEKTKELLNWQPEGNLKNWIKSQLK